MSETEHWVGKLVPVLCYDDSDLEEQCKFICEGRGLTELDSYYESYQEYLEDQYYEEYYIGNNIIYEVKRKEIDPYDDIHNAVKMPDGSIAFEIRWYNGGASYRELLDVALDEMENENEC